MRYLLCLVLVAVLFLVAAPAAQAATGGTLTGRILDADGRPVTGAEVYVYDSRDIKRPGDFISNRTAADGRYHVVLPAGRYWAVARQRIDGARFGPLTPMDKHSGEAQPIEFTNSAELQLDFTVVTLQEAARSLEKKREDFFRVQGRIVDQADQPLGMAYVMASTLLKTAAEVPEYLSAWSDKDGNFVLYLPAGNFRLAAATEFPPATGCELTQQLTVSADLENFVITARCLPETKSGPANK